MNTISCVNSNLWRRTQGKRFPVHGLVCYAPLWHPELSGSPFTSKDLNAHACTVTGATWGSQGRTFAGSEKVTIPDTASLQLTHVGAVGVWVYPTSVTGYNTIVSKGDFNSARNGYILVLDTDLLRSAICSATDYTNNSSAAGVVVINTWQQIWMVWDGTNSLIYKDGALVKSVTQTVDAKSDVYDLLIGNDNVLGSFFDGIIGGVFIYNRALTASEIVRIYQATKWRYQ